MCRVGFFLLFKQKTAYDMRISDLSSDVGSSDRSHLIAANVEAAQPVDQLPRDLADREVAPVSVGIGKTIEQRRHSGGERHFEVQRERIVIDSGHGAIRTK